MWPVEPKTETVLHEAKRLKETPSPETSQQSLS